jgi:hypothetical protein
VVAFTVLKSDVWEEDCSGALGARSELLQGVAVRGMGLSSPDAVTSYNKRENVLFAVAQLMVPSDEF